MGKPDDIGTILYKCTNGHKTYDPITREQKDRRENLKKEPEPETVELTHLNDIENPKYTGKQVSVTVTISSNSVSYRVAAEVSASVLIHTNGENEEPEVYPQTETIDITDPFNLSLIDASQEAVERRLKHLFVQGKATNLKIKQARTIYLLRVRPPVQSVKQENDKQVDESGREYKHYDVYIITDKPLSFMSAAKIKLTGIPTANPKTQRTTLLAYNVEFLDTIENYDSTLLDQLKTRFNGLTVQERWNWILDNAERDTQIIGRRNVAALTYLTYFTPLKVTLYGDIQRGWGLSDIVGDSTTGKSETLKKIQRRLNAGTILSAETASIAGIIGAASQMDNGSWFVDWGCLPLMHRKLLGLDGCHKIPQWDWAKTAEAERSGVLNISKAAKAIVPAYTRQIKIYNAVDKETPGYPTKQLCEFLYPIQAYPTIADPTTIARRDIAVFVDARDVAPERINQKPEQQHEPEYELLSEALKWCWSNTADVTFTDEALTYLLQKATELFNTFYYAPIPLVSADMKFKLARLSIAAAYLTFSTEDYHTVTVTTEHVDLVVRFLTEEYSKAGLNVLAQKHRFEALTPEDVEALFVQIEAALTKSPIERSKLYTILGDFVTDGYTNREQLKTKYELAEKNQLVPLVAILQTTGLAKSGKGYLPTNKLIEAYKVTNNFALLARVACLQNDTPLSNSPQEQPPLPKEIQRGDTVLEQGKVGNLGKTQQPLDLSKVVSCTAIPAIERRFNQTCPACGETRDIVWLLKFFDNTTAAVCNTCGSNILEKRQKEENKNEPYY
jgi:hypothetical protein